MKIDVAGFARPIDAGASAAAIEAGGYDAFWSAEASHDVFMALMLAAEHTSTISLGTGIAIAFARTPMTVAISANDLQLHSRGRFLLGLGPQIKPHITKRYSMPWSAPAARMREFVQAMHAIWDCWATGEPLGFRGEFYTHTLMTPIFSPGPNPYGRPPVYLAGVGAKMTEVAGEVADGFSCHPIATPKFIREVTLPALERGRANAARDLGKIEIGAMPFVVTGATQEAFDQAVTATKMQMGFYFSTPSYRPVLEVHGFGDLQDELNAMSKRGEWVEMGKAIPDDVFAEFACVGEPHEIAEKLTARFGGLVDRVSLNTTYESDPSLWPPIVAAMRALSTS